MRTLLHLLLPARADNTIRGVKLPVYVFSVITAISTARSLIHLLAPDGGAGSIAGIDLAKAGKSGTIFGFGLWGSSQVLYALIQVVVVSRYRSLVPLMYVLLILETRLAYSRRTHQAGPVDAHPSRRHRKRGDPAPCCVHAGVVAGGCQEAGRAGRLNQTERW
jgi:hypothetical protein